MKLNFLKKIDTKTKIIAIMTLTAKAQTGMEKCKQHSTSIIDRANLGFVLMSIEDALKIEKKKPEMNQEVIKLLSGIVEWLIETLKKWKEQKWEEIDFEVWQELIDYFLREAATLQNSQLALSLEKKA